MNKRPSQVQDYSPQLSPAYNLLPDYLFFSSSYGWESVDLFKVLGWVLSCPWTKNSMCLDWNSGCCFFMHMHYIQQNSAALQHILLNFGEANTIQIQMCPKQNYKKACKEMTSNGQNIETSHRLQVKSHASGTRFTRWNYCLNFKLSWLRLIYS